MGVLDQLLLAKAPETGVVVIVLSSGKILDDRVGFGQQRDLYLPAAGSGTAIHFLGIGSLFCKSPVCVSFSFGDRPGPADVLHLEQSPCGQLLEGQGEAGIDVLTGASSFKKLAAAVLEQARKGDSSAVPVDTSH